MVKVTNGVDTFEVTMGAYKDIFASQGYKLITEAEVVPQMSSGEPSKTEEELFLEEIVEKPVSEWTKDELKKFADLNEISLDGIHSVNDVREVIKNYIG